MVLDQVELIYLTEACQYFTPVELTSDATVREVIQSSGILLRFPQINLDELSVGIFSKIVTLDTKVKPGDRIEIYRPLTISPMERRRRLALSQS